MDVRSPDVIRISPVPLYNSFEDVWRTVDSLRVVLTDPEECDRRIAIRAKKSKKGSCPFACPWASRACQVVSCVLIGAALGIVLGKRLR